MEIKGAYLRYAFWNYETKSDCWVCETRHYYKSLVSFGDPYSQIDSDIDKSQIEYILYLEENGVGVSYITTVKHTDVDTAEKVPSVWQLDNHRESKAPYTDNMRIVVNYKGKKVYEVENIRGFRTPHNEGVRYKSFPQGKIIYDGYQDDDIK